MFNSKFVFVVIVGDLGGQGVQGIFSSEADAICAVQALVKRLNEDGNAYLQQEDTSRWTDGHDFLEVQEWRLNQITGFNL